MKLAACSLALALALPMAANATIINLSGTSNSSPDGSNAIQITLAPGQYTITPVIDAFTAFHRFGDVTGCNASGASCVTGFEWSFVASTSHPVTGVDFANCCGDDNGQGAIGPLAGGGYFATASEAFNHALSAYGSIGPFTVTTPTLFKFWLFDDVVSDNSGGVSFNLASVTQGVPEPASWAMMLLGFFGLGALMRKRRRRALA